MTRKVNVAILLDNKEIFLWEYRILEELIRSGCSNIRLLINNNVEYPKLRNQHFPIFYLLHEKLDRLIFRNKFDFDNKVNVLERITELHVIELINGRIKGDLITDDQNSIKNYNLDIILNFGLAPINGDLLKVCKLGALTYSISNHTNRSTSPSCYWEVVKKMPEIEAVIKLVNDDPTKETVIYRTGISPYPNSINVNRNNIYGFASLLIPRIINGISKNGYSFLEELMKNNDNVIESSNYSDLHYPSSYQAFSNLILLFTNYIIKKFWHKKTERWFLIINNNDKNEIPLANFGSFKEIKAPKDKFWADPFVISKDKHHYLFIEEYLIKAGKAHISVLKLDNKFNLLSCEKILEKSYHISYPHIIKHDGSYYMIPESGSNNTIGIYKCTDFPYRWDFVMNLMENIPARDSTLFFYNSKWWLFSSVIVMNCPTMSFSELFLYYSDDLLSSNWQSHPKNPIVSDHKISRPAGNLFLNNDKIYRPSQDCSGHYGKALNISCITKLSEAEYEEVLVKKIEPTWNKKLKGTHTYNFDDKVIVMDVF